jgi:dTDP-4-amino-4,6-dideoxygalactose transaminase
MVPFFKPSLPNLDALKNKLESSFDTGTVTNFGPYHLELEKKLENYLGVKNVILCANGTMALYNAILACSPKGGEIISTPFTFVATTNAILASGHTINFCDVDNVSLNLDPTEVEKCIKPETKAVVATHCYGNLCDVRAFQDIGKKYNLKIIYDASHCFGISDKGGSIMRHGDVATLSFHATKVFNTIEGGAVVTNDDTIAEAVRWITNFGLNREGKLKLIGLNSKLSELHCAVGLLNFKNFDFDRARREDIFKTYKTKISSKHFQIKLLTKGQDQNFGYFPLMHNILSGNEIAKRLQCWGVETKRYFYPLTSTSAILRGQPRDGPLSNAIDAAEKIICLPIYPAMSSLEVGAVVEALHSVE